MKLINKRTIQNSQVHQYLLSCTLNEALSFAFNKWKSMLFWIIFMCQFHGILFEMTIHSNGEDKKSGLHKSVLIKNLLRTHTHNGFGSVNGEKIRSSARLLVQKSCNLLWNGLQVISSKKKKRRARNDRNNTTVLYVDTGCHLSCWCWSRWLPTEEIVNVFVA